LTIREIIGVQNHPAFVPTAIPPAPQLQLKNGTPAPTLGELLFLPLNHLRRIPIEYANLACATMLPDTHELNIPACIKTLREWTEQVRNETARHIQHFNRAPDKYNNSEAFYRAMMLITVVQQDFGVSYDPGCRDTIEFKSSREGFIHGLLTGNRTGTCANMPMLYAAIGRALGYRSTSCRRKGIYSFAGPAATAANDSMSKVPAKA
jgi:hypothetical protein